MASLYQAYLIYHYQRRCITGKRQPLFGPICDHFPGGGILELQTESSWEWPFIVDLF